MFLKTITSDRIILRPYEVGDISYWQRWDTDPDVQAFLPEPKNEPTSQETSEQYLKECENEQDGYYGTIVWKENNLPIGTISVTELNKYHGIGELGIVIGEKEYWGRGVAQEAIKNVLEFAHDINLRRITAEIEEDNIGMEKVLIKSGFNKEGLAIASRIKNNKPINTIRYFVLL